MTLTRDQKISQLMSILVIGFGAAAIFYYYCGILYGLPFPNNTFLTAPVSKFGDFFATLIQWQQTKFNGIGFGSSYFPATYLALEPFDLIASTHLFQHPNPLRLALILFESLIIGFIFWLAFRSLRSDQQLDTLMRAFVCTFMSYPMLFTLVTGNVEALLFISLALFVLFYSRGKTTLSTAFLGLCIAMKLFPAVFVILFIANKQYRPFFYVGLWAVFFTLLPLMIFDGGIWDGFAPYLQRLHASQNMYYNLMIVELPGNHFGHSLMNGIRVLFGQKDPLNKMQLHGYALFSLSAFAGLSLYLWRVERVLWKQIALMVCAMCLLPYTSTDYKLLHFFLPLFLFINDERSDGHDRLYIWLFGLLLIPKGYITFYHLDFYNTNVVLNTGSMLLLVGVIIRSGLKERCASRREELSDSHSLT